MKEIKLTQGYVALVDDEDYDRVNQFKWCYNHGYATRNIRKEDGKRTLQALHTFKNQPPEGMRTDHINKDTLDNRKENLRSCTRAENARNSEYTGKTSQYKGVHFHKRWKHWVARIRVDGKQLFLGSFKDEIEAAKSYNKAAIKYHGEFAGLNHSTNHP